MNDTIEARFDDPEAGLDLLLNELPAGYKVQIKRLEPEWCNGVVGTFDVDEGEAISPEWISKRFGGRKFQVKLLDENSKYVKVRTISFPDVPRKNGLPIVPGPNGPILACEVQAAAPPAQDNQMVGVLEKILAGQTAQANQMQDMLLHRVQGLETILTQKLTEPAAAAPTFTAPDPQSQLKQTLETVRAIEELKGVIGGNAEVDGEGETDNPIYNKIIEKLVEKFTADPPKQPQQSQQQPQSRKYPPGYVPPPHEPSDIELAGMVKRRLRTLPDDQREMLLSQVLDDDEPETLSNDGQEDIGELESLLTPEDLEAMQSELEDETDYETEPNNESEKVSPLD